MAVFREAVIEWAGEEYTFTPSNRLLRRIDREVPLTEYMGKSQTGLRIPDTAFIVATFIRAGGGEVDEDEIAATLFEDVGANNGKGYFAITAAIVTALVPSIGDKKKPQPKPKAKRAPKKKATGT